MTIEQQTAQGHPALYAAFCDYYATGEGRTVIVALSSTPEAALRIFRERASPYFVPEIEVIESGGNQPCEANAVERWLPAELLMRAKHGPLDFFGMFYQNLS